jgi:hypothetical protein
MRHKTFILLVFLLLGVAACNEAAVTPTAEAEPTAVPTAEPTDEPTAEPTTAPTATTETAVMPDATADNTENFAKIESEKAGVSLRYPPLWATDVEEDTGDINLATHPDLLQAIDFNDGATFTVLPMPIDVLPQLSPQPVDPRSPQEVLTVFINLLQDQVQSNMNGEIEFQQAAQTTTIDEHITAVAPAIATTPDRQIYMLFATILEEDQVLFVLGVTPLAQEGRYRPAMVSMLRSIEFMQ